MGRPGRPWVRHAGIPVVPCSRSILVIRGGAIGDFILTLPALKLLRGGFPDCRIEIVGYPHICALARKRYYADEVRSIQYAPMAGFFNPRSDLNPELSEYFSGFHQVVSYLFDPDGFFAGSLLRCGVKNLLSASPLVTGTEHAARQLARPLESLALRLESPAAEVFPSQEDIAAAGDIMKNWDPPVIAAHPGSGSEKKNWPVARWSELIRSLMKNFPAGTVAVIGGESDTLKMRSLRDSLGSPARLRFVENLPLCTLAALLSKARFFIGHDSGISHLAAATGIPCLILFGPTDPAIWAPRNPLAKVLRPKDADLTNLPMEKVLEQVLPHIKG